MSGGTPLLLSSNCSEKEVVLAVCEVVGGGEVRFKALLPALSPLLNFKRLIRERSEDCFGGELVFAVGSEKLGGGAEVGVWGGTGVSCCESSGKDLAEPAVLWLLSEPALRFVSFLLEKVFMLLIGFTLPGMQWEVMCCRFSKGVAKPPMQSAAKVVTRGGPVK